MPWRFTSDLCARFTYRGAAQRTGLSKEGLRKYVDGLSQPNRTTRQKPGELFLQMHAGGIMSDRVSDGEWGVRARLIRLLPKGEEVAHEQLAKIFELAKRFPDEVPDFVDEVHRWMDLQISGEYSAEERLESFAAHEPKWKRESRRLRELISRVREAMEEERRQERSARLRERGVEPDDRAS